MEGAGFLRKNAQKPAPEQSQLTLYALVFKTSGFVQYAL
jgi:hypothetical protein